MKFKYTGDQDAITLRGVTFEKGKAVELDADDPHAALLAAKVAALPYFEAVKPRRKAEAVSDADEG